MQKHLMTARRKMKLGQVSRVGFGAVLVVIVGMGITSKLSTNILIESLNWVIHTYTVKEQLRALEKQLVDAETGQRGYIFTGENDFLEPYNQSIQDINNRFITLKDLIKDNPKQLKNLTQVEQLTQQKMSELTATIALKRAGNEQALKTLVLSRKGKAVMDQIRLQVDEMIQIENALLQKRTQDANQAEQLSTGVTIGGTLLAFALGVSVLSLLTRKVVHPINQVSSVIANASSEIAATVEQQERMASQQATAVSQTTTTMDELGASSQQSAEQAKIAAQAAKHVSDLVHVGTTAVEHTLDDMMSLKTKVSAIATQILRLSEQTNQIGTITNLVTDLANQTNMLALNAAIEAVRAGEQGKGFTVVATEIRKLADQSKQSAEKINGLVGLIQTAIDMTVIATNEGTKTVDQGMNTAQETAETFTHVADAINNVVLSSEQISLTAKQQAIATQQVIDAMDAINRGAVQTASGISQTKISTQRLNEAAVNLQTVV